MTPTSKNCNGKRNKGTSQNNINPKIPKISKDGNRKNIKRIRKEKSGLAKKDVAWFLGISTGTYEKIEKDGIGITLAQLEDIADILEVTPEQILGYEGHPFCVAHIHINHFTSGSGANQRINLFYGEHGPDANSL